MPIIDDKNKLQEIPAVYQILQYLRVISARILFQHAASPTAFWSEPDVDIISVQNSTIKAALSLETFQRSVESGSKQSNVSTQKSNSWLYYSAEPRYGQDTSCNVNCTDRVVEIQ